MSKEYFSHDYNSRSDPKLRNLLMKHGTSGIGIYWCIIELLYEQGGYIPLSSVESIAFELHEQCERITSVLKDFDLFRFEEDKMYSESVLKRLALRDDKSRKASSAAFIRWGNDAKAMRTHSKRNAIKGNKSKLNKIKRKGFIPPSVDDVIKYFEESGYTSESAKKMFQYYNVSDWIDSKGNNILNWKQKAIQVWFKPENKKPVEKKITGLINDSYLPEELRGQ